MSSAEHDFAPERLGDMQAALANALAAVPPMKIDPDTYYSVVTPMGATREVIDLEPAGLRPRRPHGTTRVNTADSFAYLLNEYDGMMWPHGGSGIYRSHVYVTDGGMSAILNDHGSDAPGWRDWRVEWEFKKSPEWQEWLDVDGKMLSQTEFAEFIEDHVDEILMPLAADMLELAQSFRASRNATFSSDKRLASGQTQVAYHETLEASGAGGQIEIPETITIRLPLMPRGMDSILKVRFRYRLADGHLTLGVRIIDKEGLWRGAVDEEVGKVRAATGAEPVYGYVV